MKSSSPGEPIPGPGPGPGPWGVGGVCGVRGLGGYTIGTGAGTGGLGLIYGGLGEGVSYFGVLSADKTALTGSGKIPWFSSLLGRLSRYITDAAVAAL